MEEQISHSFKLQWIEHTLNYIKNDNQVILEYPVMPIHHMESLHNSIWNCKHERLEDKLIYSPVEEALKIFSVKYNFKVTAYECDGGAKGHFVIEKIPKKNSTQNQTMEDSFELVNGDSQSTDNEETESIHSQAESPLNRTQIKTKSKTKTKIFRSKTEKFIIDKQKIIDSISPQLLKKALKNILEFLQNESEASIIFSDLAPVEAKFLENFLSIYKKRQSFEEALTPACNDLMNKMCQFFKEFDKHCRLEVYVAKFRGKTTKRQVKFIKVPRYTRNKANLQQIKSETVNIKSENKQSPTNSPNSSQVIQNSGIRITIANENTNKSDHKQNRGIKLPNIGATGLTDKKTIQYTKDEIMSIDAGTKSSCVIDKVESAIKAKMLVNAITNRSQIANRLNINRSTADFDIDYTHVKLPNDNKKDNRLPITEVDITDSKHNIEAKCSNVKDNKRDATIDINIKCTKVEPIDNRYIKNVGITDDKLIVSDKELLKREIDEIVRAKDATKKTTVPVKKSPQIEKPTNNIKAPDLTRASRKEKLLHAMSTPLESDKALRMMRLMGWEGGALGLRGEGIIEPIIPALDIVPGKGLGHEKGKSQPKQEKLSKVENRTVFLKTIKDLITSDSQVKSATYTVVLSKKESKCFKEIIHSINTRRYLCLSAAENAILAEIIKILTNDPDLTLDMCVNNDTKLLTITKSRARVVETKADKKKKPQLMKETTDEGEDTIENVNKQSLRLWKIYFCSTLLDFVKSEETSKEICFSFVISEKLVNFIKNVCSCINKRTAVPSGNIGKLSLEILAHIKDGHLAAEFDAKRKRTVILRKVSYQKPRIDNEVIKYVVNKYTNSTITDENSLPEEVNNNKDNQTIKHNAKDLNKDQSMQNTSTNNDINNEVSTVAFKVIDSVNNSTVSDTKLSDNKELNNVNHSDAKTNIVKNQIDDGKFNNNYKESLDSDSKGVNIESEQIDVLRHPLSVNDVKNTSSDNDGDYRRIDRNLIQRTIDSLTSHNNNLEDNILLHNINKGIDINYNNLESKNLHISNKLKNNNCDNIGDSSKITTNSRNWYELSEHFLIHDNTMKSSSQNINRELNNILNKLTDVKINEPSDLDSYHNKTNIDNTTTKFRADEKEVGKSNEILERSPDFDDEQTIANIGHDVLKPKDVNKSMELHQNDIDINIETRDKKKFEIENNNQKHLIDSNSRKPEELKEPEKTVDMNSSLYMAHSKSDNTNDLKCVVQNNKNCHDILLIESNIVGIHLIQKKVQNHIENLEDFKEFLPVIKYQGVLDNGVVYSCHNKATCLWLKDVLCDYNIIDYRNVTKVHKVKINITSFNKDTKKFLELLEIYNEGLKCRNWSIIFEKYFHYLLTIVVEIDDVSFEYICDNNFSLFVGYGVAQFSIGL